MKIAVVIPCYNSIEFVEKCLESVQDQDYDDIEIYAYDNGSTDGTLEFLKEKQKLSDNLFIREVENIYPNSYREAFESAFETIDTEYITFVASDDYISKTYISKCMEVMLHNPKKIKCIQSPIIGVQGFPETSVGEQSHKYKSLEEFKKICLRKSPVNTPTVFYHKSLYEFLSMEAHSENDLTPSGAGDYDMFCSLADNGIMIYPIPRHMGYYYRWHENQCTWKVHENKKNVDYDIIIKKYWEKKWKIK
jgi:glycosyltransferase involved in cell wall biosynthesis